jgi:oligopeptide/dipeptide ABC transporter ATP-binding protein
MGVVLITHDMGVIASRTDRVVVMYAGKVAEEADTGQLFRHMRHPYTEALLASVPKIDQDPTERLLTIPGLPPDLSVPHTNCRFSPRCQYATDRCREEEPELVEVVVGGTRRQRFACFHPIGDKPPAVPAPTRVPTGSEADGRTPPPSDRAEILRIEHLVKEFPVRGKGVFRRSVGSVKAVSDVSFSVHEGETFGLVGESGCGKTTVARSIVSLEHPTSGRISFEGSDLAAMPRGEFRKHRRDLQLMFQDPYASLDPRMRVGAIIKEPLDIQGVGGAASRRERVRDLLVEAGLNPEAVSRYPHEFSGGQRQRISLARSLALEPKLIVADEPVSALDVSIQAQILNLMKDLQKRRGLTLVMISHDLAVIRYMADTIGVMYLGKLVELGPAADVYDRAAHPYTQGLLDAVPVAEPPNDRPQREVKVRGELPSALEPPSGCRFRTRCPRATDLCAEVEPPLSDFGHGHVAACHFPLQAPVQLSGTIATSASL